MISPSSRTDFGAAGSSMPGRGKLKDDERVRPQRLVDAAEFAQMLGVTEDDVLEWMIDGHIPYLDGPEGEPRVRIAESYTVDGPLSSWEANIPASTEPAFLAELARQRREHELAALDWGEVNVGALAEAFADRLRAAAPYAFRVCVDEATVLLHDWRGHGAGGIDMAYHASSAQNGSGADRVRAAAASALRNAQDDLTMVTTDPWPQHGPGQLPDPHAEITRDGETVRLFYGDSAHPVLELEPLRIADVLTITTS